MLTFLIRRLLWFVPVLVVLSAMTFALMKAAPGGPWDRDPEAKQVDPRTLRLLEQQYGLDKPSWRQYTAYMLGDVDASGTFVCGAVCGNLGPSYRQRGQMVQDILFKPPNEDSGFFQSKFGHSVRLGLLSLLIALAIGIPAGVISALRQNTLADYAIALLTNVGVAVPSFVVAFFSILVFAVFLGWMPVIQRSWQNWTAWLVPALVFGYGTMAGTARLMRASVLDVMRQDFVRTARAKGAREHGVIWRHMLRNALIPVITTLGPALAGLISGSIVIETIYNIPGVGRDFILAIGNRDYSMIMGTTLLLVMIILLANLSVDILFGLVDPRIRVE